MQAYSQGSGIAAYQSVAAHGRVAAADPHKLVVMLLDGALDRIAGARGAMQNGVGLQKTHLVHNAVELVNELHASLNFEAGGQIAANLGDLYDYSARRLLQASLENKPEVLDEVSTLLREIRGAWVAISPQAPAAMRAAP